MIRKTILAAAVLAGAWLIAQVAGADRSADPDDAERVALGATVYAEQCAACHGADLEGAPDWRTPGPDGRFPAPPHDATGHTWHHPDDMLFTITRDGLGAVVPGYESDMPAFAGVLSDEEIWAVLAYIKSHWPEQIRRHHDRLNEAAGDAP